MTSDIYITQTDTHPFNGPLSVTTRVSRYQKCKTNLDFTEATDSEWQCHQLGHMQGCSLLQADNHASTPPLSFFTGRMPFLPPNQQRQSTKGTYYVTQRLLIIKYSVFCDFRIQGLSRTSPGQLGIFCKTLQYTASRHATKFTKQSTLI